MEMTVRHVVEFSPQAQAVLEGLVSAVAGSGEAKVVEIKDCACSRKSEETTADTVPAKKPRKPRAKKAEPEVTAPMVDETPVATAEAEAEPVAIDPYTFEPVAIDPYTSEQVQQMAYKAFEALQKKGAEAPISPDALATKAREILLGVEKAHDPECHEMTSIDAMNADQRIEFVEYIRSADVGCGAVVDEVMANS